MKKKHFSEEEILQFYNLIGLDKTELNYTRRHFEEGMDIEYLIDLYNISSAKYLLPTSSREVAERYTILHSILNDDFWFETSDKRRDARRDSMKILEEVCCLNVTAEESMDATQNFERVNEILKVALLGLCSCGNPSGLRWQVNKTDLNELLNKKVLSPNADNKAVRMLYELLILVKLPDTGVDYKIFDENNQISEEQLLKVISEKLENNEKREEKEKDKKESPYKKELAFRRPTLKELKSSL